MKSQVLPAENSKLNYRIVGFSFPPNTSAIKYRIDIARGNWVAADSFERKIIKSVSSKVNQKVIEVPFFAQCYTWRMTCTLKNTKVLKGPLYHFSTMYQEEIDSNKVRLRILNKAIKYQDSYIFMDGSCVLYDMKGNPVWYLPGASQGAQKIRAVRDLKISPQHTITYILNGQAYEKNYDGDTLWAAPKHAVLKTLDSENYHHEFTRLSNGHYMILAMEKMPFIHNEPLKNNLNRTDFIVSEDRLIPIYDTAVFSMLIEFDKHGKKIWSWKSSQYFLGSDIVNFIPQKHSGFFEVHENAFFFDERHSIIYISCRNISRILKVKYPSGNVIASYGEVFKQGITPQGNGLFCGQHAIRRSDRGYLYLFNNDICGGDSTLPKVIVLQESANGKKLKKVWEYECSANGILIDWQLRKLREETTERYRQQLIKLGWAGNVARESTGGNVIELPDQSFFVCMSSEFSKVFIVSKAKKILWCATPELWDFRQQQWVQNSNQYRATIISRKELENIIWSKYK